MITLLLQLPAKCLVKISKVELSQHHGERGHPALQGVLEHVALEAEADHHEGKSKACDHEAHGHHVPEVKLYFIFVVFSSGHLAVFLTML